MVIRRAWELILTGGWDLKLFEKFSNAERKAQGTRPCGVLRSVSNLNLLMNMGKGRLRGSDRIKSYLFL